MTAVFGGRPQAPPALRRLARAYGVQTSYVDAGGTRRTAGPDGLLAVLRALGAEMDGVAGAQEALRAHTARRRGLPPVVVAWNGRTKLRPPGPWALELEDGSERGGHDDALPRLALGYHRLRAGGREALVISAPRRAPAGARTWGFFLPLYAARSQRNRGCGDLADLRTLGRLTSDLGGGLVGTLPLYAAFLDEPFEPSPYAPVSRLHLNELYCALDALPEYDGSAPRFDDAPVVDYRTVAKAKRAALELCLERLEPARADAFEAWLRAHPGVVEYARFRANVEQPGARRRRPSRPLGPAPAERYHAFAQWVMSAQIREAGADAALYLDLPLGVHPHGYDPWRYPHVFVEGISVGAPPDAFFSKGQDWGFAPPHPEASREHAYDYAIACARTVTRMAARGAVRIDHVMGLHRLYWVPSGLGPTEGVYVRYPSEELYAIWCLEGSRAGVAIVGEDLGTVPESVRRSMRSHGFKTMYVLPFEVGPSGAPEPPAGSVAALNTHDTATWAGWWNGADITLRRDLGLLTEAEAAAARTEREALRALAGSGDVALLLERLAASDADIVLVNLEDLWAEDSPQNVPGTTTEHPNWCRKAARTLSDVADDASIADLGRRLTSLRKQGAA